MQKEKEFIMLKTTPIISISNKRIFYNPQKFLRFLETNDNKIQSVNIHPAILGKNGFGSIEVKIKSSYERKTITI